MASKQTAADKRTDAKLDKLETKSGGRGKQSPAQAKADAKLDRGEPREKGEQNASRRGGVSGKKPLFGRKR